jgi:putative RecB family exonuclease
MTVYSHSRLSTFEQCPHKFKLRYIDKVETDVEESVEAFMGIRVHETLKKLYQYLMYQNEDTLGYLFGFLRDEWATNWNNSITIVKKEPMPDQGLCKSTSANRLFFCFIFDSNPLNSDIFLFL